MIMLLALRLSLFQSLRGVGLGWSERAATQSLALSPVSIPERGWVGLELRDNIALIIRKSVSIPERGWVGLEPRFSGSCYQFGAFQSLRGVGLGWSSPGAGTNRDPSVVSIPERGWVGLEPAAPVPVQASGRVSIPERGWVGLERQAMSPSQEAIPCFNP